MGLSRSTFYDPAPATLDAGEVLARIGAICDEFECYGYRRVGAALRHQGMVVNSKKLRRLMREHDLQPKRRRRYVVTTDSDHDGPIFPDLAKEVAPDRPNQLWVADLTYISVSAGFVYLAAILDAWSRKVVGYAISRSMEARIAVAALKAAIRGRNPPKGCIHHSDRGSQGEFNWSLQHSGQGGCDGRSASVGSCVAEQAAFAGATSGRAADAPAAFLGIDRGGGIERGRGDWCGRVGTGRSTVVSGGRRHATIDACAIIEAVIGSIPVVCRAGGARDPACPRRRGAADLPVHGAVGIDDLA